MIPDIHVNVTPPAPTIWPLDKDAFDVSDLDHAATAYRDLNLRIAEAADPSRAALAE
ncbi:MAG: hypothetical protein JOZ07_11920 [Solirubrobacterales bacterium]|nr:hypothetical protein [Solirubrobacterales bacterium]